MSVYIRPEDRDPSIEDPHMWGGRSAHAGADGRQLVGREHTCSVTRSAPNPDTCARPSGRKRADLRIVVNDMASVRVECVYEERWGAVKELRVIEGARAPDGDEQRWFAGGGRRLRPDELALALPRAADEHAVARLEEVEIDGRAWAWRVVYVGKARGGSRSAVRLPTLTRSPGRGPTAHRMMNTGYTPALRCARASSVRAAWARRSSSFAAGTAADTLASRLSFAA